MSTITTIQPTDAVSDSRAVINTNFANLNTDKIEAAQTVALTHKDLTSTTNLLPPIAANGNMPNMTLPYAFVSNAGSGDVDIYTCPSNRRALVYGLTVFNSAGTTTTYVPEIKISGSYYHLLNSLSINTLIGTNQNLAVVLEAGESISINTSQSGMNVWYGVFEFDNTSNIKKANVTNSVNGNNTVFTTTSGKTAYLLSTLGSFRTSTGGFLYYNGNASTATVIGYIVANGDSPSNADRITSSTSVNTTVVNLFAIYTPVPSLSSLVVNTNQTTGYIHVAYIEI